MEDELSVPLDGKGISDLRVVDLKQELDKRGLSKSGSKKDLVKRLKQQIDFEKLCEERKGSIDSESKIKLDAATEQNEFVRQYLAQQQKRMEEKRLAEEGCQMSDEEQSEEDGEKEVIITENALPQAEDKSKISKCNKIKLILRTKGSDKSVSEINEGNKAETILSDSDKDKTETTHDAPLVFARKSKVPEISVNPSEDLTGSETKTKISSEGSNHKIGPKSPPDISESVTKSESDDESSKASEEARQKDSTEKSKLDDFKDRLKPEYDSKKFIDHYESFSEVKSDSDGCHVTKNLQISKKSAKSPGLHENSTKCGGSAKVNYGISEGEGDIPSVSQNLSESKEDLEKPITVFEEEKPKKGPRSPIDGTKHIASQEETQGSFNVITHMKLSKVTESLVKGSVSESLDPVDVSLKKMQSRESAEKSEQVSESKKMEVSDHGLDPYKVSTSNTSENSSLVDVKNISLELKSESLTYAAEDKPSSKACAKRLLDSDDETTILQSRKIHIRFTKQSPLTQSSKKQSEASSSTELLTSLKSLNEKSPKQDNLQLKNRQSSSKMEGSEIVDPQGVHKKVAKEYKKISSTTVSPAEQVGPSSNISCKEEMVEMESSQCSSSEESLHDVPYVSRKVLLSNRKSNRLSTEDSEPKQKKSKWGSFASKKASQTISISTDSIKNWFPDFKLISEPSVPVEVESEDHTVLVSEDKPLQVDENDEESKNASVSGMEVENIESQEPNIEETSDQGPVSKMIFIQNLVRPFTLNQLKTLLRQSGNFVEESFWIDKIKSKCFVMYETEKDALKAKNALHNTRWPASNPKILAVEFSNEEELELHKKGSEHPPKPAPEAIVESSSSNKVKVHSIEEKRKERERHRERDRQKPQPSVREWDKDKIVQESPERESLPKEEKRSSEKKEKKDSKKRTSEDTSAKLLDDLFQKTKSTPCIYWLPLTEEQVQQKEDAKKLRKQEREKRMQQMKEQEESERRNRRARTPRRSREKENRKSSTRSRSPVTRRR